MGHRLQVLIPEELDARIEKAAQRKRMSKGAWVRLAIEDALARRTAAGSAMTDPLARLASLNAPTADIDAMLTEIESGRS
ncbi:MAG TPA: CopG family transcriptional regulator [Bryobacteraceae bacterium]|nr:CopG family transcriptional regulator [Bryobacteraceae bacterium]